MESFSTLGELILFQASKFNNPKALNWIPDFKKNNSFHSFSSQEFLTKIFHFACGLRELGLKKQQTLVNFSYQNPIWLIVDLGTILAGGVTVPIFHNISRQNLLYEICDAKTQYAKTQYVFTDNAEFFEIVKDVNFDLTIITCGFVKENSVSFEDLIALGQKAAAAKKYDFDSLLKALNPQDLATIIYTSGTTGKPKGVKLSHQNLISQIKDAAQFFPLFKEDKALSFLPLAHIFERMVVMFYISRGISVYFADDVKNVGTLLKELKPTILTSVPRVLEKVFLHIRQEVNGGSFLKKFFGQKALKRALTKNIDTAKNFCDKNFDLLVYQKFRAALGGNIRMIICGGAALSQDLERFYNNIGINLFCGYGTTESSPVLSANCEKAYKFATVGKAFPSVELKVAADGELLARGLNIMLGYHNQPQETAAIIENGWLKTGDLAQIDEAGFVTITGRKKELFKTANGKYVSPVPIEQKLVQNLEFLLGAVIIAEGKKFTSALLFCDFEVLKKTKEKFGFSEDDEKFLKSENLQRFVQKNIEEINKNLDNWEQIKKFYLALENISIESGEITPSMKLKRKVLEEKYKNVIDEFYCEKF
jgi:long-chain acyl-CoA synthetase